MGVDFLRLHCVRGDLEVVCRTVESLVRRNGWQLVRPGTKPAVANFQKDVSIREESGWIVVDAGEGHFEPWAARIAASLRTTGITMTSSSDEDAIEIARYDSERRTKRVAHRCDSKRRPVRLGLGFLEDLVPPAQRSALRRGVLLRPLESDSALREIARLAALPRPLAAHEWPTNGRLLRFEHSPPPKIDRATARSATKRRRTRTMRVLFEETFHVRGVGRKAIERAMAETLAVHDFIPVSEDADPVAWAAGILRVFVHEERDVISLGEHAIDDGRTVPSFNWGEILSRKLGRLVVSVWRQGDAAEMKLWSRGGEGDRVELGSLASRRPGEGSLRSLERTLQRLGGSLELPFMVLEGELEGVELRFRRAGAVNHRLYQEEQRALDWGSRAPNLARLNPLFRQFADLTPEQALREQQKPARRA